MHLSPAPRDDIPEMHWGQVTEDSSGHTTEIAFYSLADGNHERILDGVGKTGKHQMVFILTAGG